MVVGKTKWFWGEFPCLDLLFLQLPLPVPGPGSELLPCSWCPGHQEQPARAPGPSRAGTELLAAAAGDHRGTPGAAGELAAGRQSKFPSPRCRSPAEGTLPRHLPLLGQTMAPRGLPPVPSGMRIPLILILLLFLPRSPLCCKCWAPRCHVPVSLPGLGDPAGSPPHPGQEPDGDFPCGSSRWYQGAQGCTPPTGIFLWRHLHVPVTTQC